MVRWLSCLLALSLFACAESGNDPGLDGWLRVRGARYVAGALPKPADGPAIVALRQPHAQVLPGLRRELLTGSLPADASAVLLGLEGDPGHWVVGAGAPAVEEPDFPTFVAELSFARATPVGPHTLTLSAVRADGTVGPRSTAAFDATARVRSELLSIELRWDTQSDLDLHVVLPDGVELSPDNINANTPPPPGAAASDPTAYQRGATLDLDSNANCVIDGRREERASWPAAPAPGRYTVLVATPSLCTQSVAHWTLQVWLGGARIHEVRGLSQGGDTRLGSGVGAGLTALAFTVP